MVLLDHLERYVLVTNTQTHERYRIAFQRWITGLLTLLGSIQPTHPLSEYVSVEQPFLSLLFLAHQLKPSTVQDDWLPRQRENEKSDVLQIQTELANRGRDLFQLREEIRESHRKNEDLSATHLECLAARDEAKRQLVLARDKLAWTKRHHDACLQTKAELERLFLITLRGVQSVSPAAIEQSYINQLHHRLTEQERQFRRIEKESGATHRSVQTDPWLENTSQVVTRPARISRPAPSTFPPDSEDEKEAMVKMDIKPPGSPEPLVPISDTPSAADSLISFSPKKPLELNIIPRLSVRNAAEVIGYLDQSLALVMQQLESQNSKTLELTEHNYQLRQETLISLTTIHQLEEHVTDLTNENEELKVKNVCSGASIRHFKTEATDLVSKLEAKEALLSKEKEEKEELQTQMTADCSRQVRETLYANEGTILALNKAMETREQEYHATEMDYRAQVDLLESQISHFKNDLRESTARVITLTDGHAEDTAIIDRLVEQVAGYADVMRSLTTYFNVPFSPADESPKAFMTVYRAVQIQYEDLGKEVDRLSITNTDLQTRLQATKLKLEETQAKSIQREKEFEMFSEDRERLLRESTLEGPKAGAVGLEDAGQTASLLRHLQTEKDNRERFKQFKNKMRKKKTQTHPMELTIQRFHHTIQLCRQENIALKKELLSVAAGHEKQLGALKRAHQEAIQALSPHIIANSDESPSSLSETVTALEHTIQYYQAFFKFLEVILVRGSRADDELTYRSLLEELSTWYTRLITHDLLNWWDEFQTILSQHDQLLVDTKSLEFQSGPFSLTRPQLELSECMSLKHALRTLTAAHAQNREIVHELKQLFNEPVGELSGILKRLTSLFTADDLTAYIGFYEGHIKGSFQLSQLDILIGLAKKHLQVDRISDMVAKASQIDAILNAFGPHFADALIKLHLNVDRSHPSIRYVVHQLDLTNANQVVKFYRAAQIMVDILELFEKKAFPTKEEMLHGLVLKVAKTIFQSERRDDERGPMALVDLLDLFPPRRKKAKKGFDGAAVTATMNAMENADASAGHEDH